MFEVLEDKAADWALANAWDLFRDAEILAGARRYPRAFALDALALQELGKTLQWRLIACGVFKVRDRKPRRSSTDIWIDKGRYFVSQRAFTGHQTKGRGLVDVLIGVLLAELEIEAWRQEGQGFRTSRMIEIMKKGPKFVELDTPEGRHVRKIWDVATRVFDKGANGLHEWGTQVESNRTRALYVDIVSGKVARPSSITQTYYEFIHGVAGAALRSLDRMLSKPIPTLIAKTILSKQPDSYDEIGAALALGYAALDHADAEVIRKYSSLLKGS